MSGTGTDLAACALGYGIGSVPVGVLVGRALRGVDVRDSGSGSMGSTNVLRTVGPRAAAATAVLDIAKGTLAVMAARGLGVGGGGAVAAGLASVVGHCWPVFARFRGGRGVATAWGALVPLSPEAAAYAVAGFAAGVGVTRIVSVGSLAAAATAAAGSVVSSIRSGSLVPVAYGLPVCALVAARHAENVRRLRDGREPKLSALTRS